MCSRLFNVLNGDVLNITKVYDDTILTTVDKIETFCDGVTC